VRFPENGCREKKVPQAVASGPYSWTLSAWGDISAKRGKESVKRFRATAAQMPGHDKRWIGNVCRVMYVEWKTVIEDAMDDTNELHRCEVIEAVSRSKVLAQNQ
jgi:hypothetical protein